MVQTASELEQEVLAADAARVTALLSQDYDAADKLFAEELTYCHSNGNQDSKQTYMDGLRSGNSRYAEMNMFDMTARIYGDTAVLSGKFTAKVVLGGGAREANLHSRVLMVWVKRDGAWQLVAWESTPTSA
jgi:ketosteroid isomerase-like protein